MNNITKPNLFVVGVQKAGTSYLCAKLSQHNQMFFSSPKELLFFQKQGLTQSDYNDYLKVHFTKAENEKYIAEGSTVYLQWPNALENIQRFNGTNQKIIVCLRHPTDRAVSFHLHNYKKGRFNGTENILTIGENIKLSPTLSSMYAEYIEKWLNVYGDNIQFLLFDDLLSSPTSFVKQATDFLNLAPIEIIDEKPVNKGFGLIWENDKLTLDINDNNRIKPVFERSQLEALHEMFLKDIDKTEQLIGKSLSSWKKMPIFTAKQKNW